MQKVSYIGDGTTTEFYFNFPFFENSNVVVTVNNQPATGYTIIGTSAGMDADIPYIGGKVVFEVAPTSIDCITIARQLPLERIVDYQPLSKINPTTLNQDLNYLMEVIKDRKDELTNLMTKYEEIADKESTGIILARITAIHDEIVDIDAKIRALGDIGTLQQRVTDLTTTVGGHTTSIGALDTDVENLNTTVGGHTTSIDGLNMQKSNIDMDNLSTTGKSAIVRLGIPDWHNGTTKGTNWTAIENGVIIIKCNQASYSKIVLKINGVTIYNFVPDISGTNSIIYAGPFPVAIGDTIIISGANAPTPTFYPYRTI